MQAVDSTQSTSATPQGSLIGNAIKDYFVDAYEKERTREIGKYYASELSGFGLGVDDICLRELAYKYKIKLPFDKSKAGVFERGDIIEEWLATGPSNFISGWQIEERQHYFKHESELGFRIGGKCDFLLKKKNGLFTKEHHIVELKTMETHSLDWLKDPKTKKPDHVMQLNFYLWLQQCQGTLVYVIPSTLQTKEFVLSPSKDLFDVMVERATRLHKYLITGELPNYVINWKCNRNNRDRKVFCEYLLQCITDGRPPL